MPELPDLVHVESKLRDAVDFAQRREQKLGGRGKAITHDYAGFNWIMSGGDLFACEGTSHGEHVDGPWRAGVPVVMTSRGGATDFMTDGHDGLLIDPEDEEAFARARATDSIRQFGFLRSQVPRVLLAKQRPL